MTGSQIRAVKDVLDTQFRNAVQTLEETAKQLEEKGLKNHLEQMERAGAKYVREFQKAGERLNEVIKDAEDDGIQLIAGHRGWDDEQVTRATACRVGLTDKERTHVKEIMSARVRGQIQRLLDLKTSTYLSLYDTKGTGLAELVAKVSADIRVIVAEKK